MYGSRVSARHTVRWICSAACLPTCRGARGSGWWGPTASARRRCCASWSGRATDCRQRFVAKGTRIGYLEQEAADGFAERSQTVYEEMLEVFAELRAREAACAVWRPRWPRGTLEACCRAMAVRRRPSPTTAGMSNELQIQQVLSGLGFQREEQHMPLAHCSGGEKTRALLARLLLERPDLLVLDEPTNHLDIDAVAWLEYDAAEVGRRRDHRQPRPVLPGSGRQRGLGDEPRGLETYRGNYSAYLTQREDRWAWRIKEFETVQAKFLKDLDFVKRNIVRESTTDRAKGLLKRLVRKVQAVQLAGHASAQHEVERLYAGPSRDGQDELGCEPGGVRHQGVAGTRIRAPRASRCGSGRDSAAETWSCAPTTSRSASRRRRSSTSTSYCSSGASARR